MVWVASDRNTDCVGGLLPVLGSAYAAGIIKLNVNGSNLQTEVAPKVVNNRVMVPISFVSKALGASVSWNDKTQTVSINTIGIPNENVWDERMDLGPFMIYVELPSSLEFLRQLVISLRR
ncbi:hypothetical protein DNH61_03855 [Paenibacillus sambharensis]|uniref:Copper amine oxidase-like N-terminal domain-containing protein n=1 Tax=Paenibacillus sambharensis TaxID=1803190 RepID=A0A2W1M0H2_9BACL|nr:hypothetical protein DNH61_03855 [Paenibacillus sambharensis]